ncbi:MAG TPA: HAMP domain-containing sensor histidine kinase, partial [Ktedonobacteraceae bacterium]|nr:HAMP domain-containing sensor histidine kinase [Ktedonobacteraceae bacterium]
MTLPLPLRLTLFYTLLLAVAIGGFGYLTYHQAEQRAYSDLDNLLRNRAASVKLGKDLFFLSQGSSVSEPIKLPGVNELGTDGVAIEVFDTKMRLLATTAVTPPSSNAPETGVAMQPSPIPWDSQAAHQLLARFSDPRRPPAGIYSTVAYEGQLVRVYTTINTTMDVQLIQTASSEQNIQQSLMQLRSTLLAGGVLVLFLALAGGYLLTWGTLAAVRRVTRTAREIGVSQDFRRRVPLKGNQGRDEIATLAQTFNVMLANLETSYQRQKRFIADASHELRAPITSIRCNLDLLTRASDLPEDEIEATLNDARSEADRMGRLVNDLLILAHADETSANTFQTLSESSRTAQPAASVDLDSLLLEVYRQYKARSEEIDQTEWPRLILQHITPVQVSGENDQLKQVLVALVDNAFKYTPSGGSITLALDVERKTAVLTVSDTGIGIAEEDLPHIFERFYRADRAR